MLNYCFSLKLSQNGTVSFFILIIHLKLHIFGHTNLLPHFLSLFKLNFTFYYLFASTMPIYFTIATHEFHYSIFASISTDFRIFLFFLRKFVYLLRVDSYHFRRSGFSLLYYLIIILIKLFL